METSTYVFKPHLFGNYDTYNCPRRFKQVLMSAAPQKPNPNNNNNNDSRNNRNPNNGVFPNRLNSFVTVNTATRASREANEQAKTSENAAPNLATILDPKQRGIKFEKDVVSVLEKSYFDITSHSSGGFRNSKSGSEHRLETLVRNFIEKNRQSDGQAQTQIHHGVRLHTFPSLLSDMGLELMTMDGHNEDSIPLRFGLSDTVEIDIIMFQMLPGEGESTVVEISVADIKSSQKTKLSHKMQVAFYAKMIATILSKSAFCDAMRRGAVRHASEGSVWLPRDPNDLSAVPSPQRGVAMDNFVRIEKFNIDEVFHSEIKNKFFGEFLPQVFSSSGTSKCNNKACSFCLEEKEKPEEEQDLPSAIEPIESIKKIPLGEIFACVQHLTKVVRLAADQGLDLLETVASAALESHEIRAPVLIEKHNKKSKGASGGDGGAFAYSPDLIAASCVPNARGVLDQQGFITAIDENAFCVLELRNSAALPYYSSQLLDCPTSFTSTSSTISLHCVGIGTAVTAAIMTNKHTTTTDGDDNDNNNNGRVECGTLQAFIEALHAFLFSNETDNNSYARNGQDNRRIVFVRDQSQRSALLSLLERAVLTGRRGSANSVDDTDDNNDNDDHEFPIKMLVAAKAAAIWCAIDDSTTARLAAAYCRRDNARSPNSIKVILERLSFSKIIFPRIDEPIEPHCRLVDLCGTLLSYYAWPTSVGRPSVPTPTPACGFPIHSTERETLSAFSSSSSSSAFTLPFWLLKTMRASWGTSPSSSSESSINLSLADVKLLVNQLRADKATLVCAHIRADTSTHCSAPPRWAVKHEQLYAANKVGRNEAEEEEEDMRRLVVASEQASYFQSVSTTCRSMRSANTKCLGKGPLVFTAVEVPASDLWHECTGSSSCGDDTNAATTTVSRSIGAFEDGAARQHRPVVKALRFDRTLDVVSQWQQLTNHSAYCSGVRDDVIDGFSDFKDYPIALYSFKTSSVEEYMRDNNNSTPRLSTNLKHSKETQLDQFLRNLTETFFRSVSSEVFVIDWCENGGEAYSTDCLPILLPTLSSEGSEKGNIVSSLEGSPRLSIRYEAICCVDKILCLKAKAPRSGGFPVGSSFIFGPRPVDANAPKVLGALSGYRPPHPLLMSYMLSGKPPPSNAAPDAIQIVETKKSVSNIKFNQAQQAFMRKVENEPVTLLWGPPGTGKTLTLASLILLLLYAPTEAQKNISILVVAFTNAALGELWDKLEQLADTNTLVLTDASTKEITTKSGKRSVILCTAYGAVNKQKAFDMLIVDEASQLRVPLAMMASTMLARDNKATRIVLAGDTLQLAPIVPAQISDARVLMSTSDIPVLHGSVLEACLFFDGSCCGGASPQRIKNSDLLLKPSTTAAVAVTNKNGFTTSHAVDEVSTAATTATALSASNRTRRGEAPNQCQGGANNKKMPHNLIQLDTTYRGVGRRLVSFIGHLYPRYVMGNAVFSPSVAELEGPFGKKEPDEEYDTTVLRVHWINNDDSLTTRRDGADCTVPLNASAVPVLSMVSSNNSKNALHAAYEDSRPQRPTFRCSVPSELSSFLSSATTTTNSQTRLVDTNCSTPTFLSASMRARMLKLGSSSSAAAKSLSLKSSEEDSVRTKSGNSRDHKANVKRTENGSGGGVVTASSSFSPLSFAEGLAMINILNALIMKDDSSPALIYNTVGIVCPHRRQRANATELLRQWCARNNLENVSITTCTESRQKKRGSPATTASLKDKNYESSDNDIENDDDVCCTSTVVVDTAERMQGQEFEVVIILLADVSRDFVLDINRLNVAFSRAKNQIHLVTTKELVFSSGGGNNDKDIWPKKSLGGLDGDNNSTARERIADEKNQSSRKALEYLAEFVERSKKEIRPASFRKNWPRTDVPRIDNILSLLPFSSPPII